MNTLPQSVHPAHSGPGNAVAAIGVLTAVATVVGLAVASGRDARFETSWLSVPDGTGGTWSASLAFRLDGLATLFGLVIAGVGVVILPWAASYFRGHLYRTRTLLLLFAFMVAMLGLVAADDLLLMFVFWEVTTIVSFLLIGFEHRQAAARRAALHALYVTAAGGLALLAGILLLGHVAGTFSLSGVLAAREAIIASDAYPAIVVLVLVSAFAKSAQVPLHFWLPGAMAAPTPISAYLHSATMVKAGIYLLARLDPALGGTALWSDTLIVFGGITAVVGAVGALRQTDLKLMLAWTTVAALGKLTLLIGIGTEAAAVAMALLLVAHALYKAGLFLVVGALEKATGTRDIRQLSGLRRALPLLAVAGALAALSKLGLIPFLGFVAKEVLYKATLDGGWLQAFAVVVAMLANVAAGAVALEVGVRPFIGVPTTPAKSIRRLLTAGPLVLGVCGLGAGLAVSVLDGSLFRPAAASIATEPVKTTAALWYGVNMALWLSVSTVVLATVVALNATRIRTGLSWVAGRTRSDRFNGGTVLDGLVAGVILLARWITLRLQNGSLWRYTRVVFVTLLVVLGGTLASGGSPAAPVWPALAAYEWLLLGLIAAATLAVAAARSRLLAICALGVVGVGTAAVFVLAGAPDLAMTQLLVDTLIVVFVALVFIHLPVPEWRRSQPHTLRIAIAAGIGVVVASMLLGVVAEPTPRGVTDWYEQASVPEAKGRNIVNVILVDFRALDTFGEIVVVGVAGLAGLALMRTRTRKEEQ